MSEYYKAAALCAKIAPAACKFAIASALTISNITMANAVTGGISFGAVVPDDNNNNGGGDNNNGDGGDPGTDGPGGPTTGNGCQIVLVQNGSLAIGTGLTTLSSKEAGGISGKVDITKTGTANLAITVEAPNAFSSNPQDGDVGVTFAASYTASGDTTSAELDGATPTPINVGLTNLNVDVTATRSTAFPAGNYESTALVRCE